MPWPVSEHWHERFAIHTTASRCGALHYENAWSGLPLMGTALPGTICVSVPGCGLVTVIPTRRGS
ncbi:hypothetical protein FHS42_003409 [Streptomyces zagrosensis]|uniref:Uncharacterized protein n=1 Tax=Streptomyces zagrosensis TaxID=1042984 RepID=A0A7W9QA30_9ACTN|nr:hypothetical protein [Streptomyces zagrosensis]